MGVHGYWNDINIEKKKPFWIESENDPKLKRFLQKETNLERCFLDALDFVAQRGLLRGRVLDVGGRCRLDIGDRFQANGRVPGHSSRYF